LIASDYGYGGILKQRKDSKEQLVRFTSGTWNDAQKNYSTIKKRDIDNHKVSRRTSQSEGSSLEVQTSHKDEYLEAADTSRWRS
jgi:hypothetical protein